MGWGANCGYNPGDLSWQGDNLLTYETRCDVVEDRNGGDGEKSLHIVEELRVGKGTRDGEDVDHGRNKMSEGPKG